MCVLTVLLTVINLKVKRVMIEATLTEEQHKDPTQTVVHFFGLCCVCCEFFLLRISVCVGVFLLIFLNVTISVKVSLKSIRITNRNRKTTSFILAVTKFTSCFYFEG